MILLCAWAYPLLFNRTIVVAESRQQAIQFAWTCRPLFSAATKKIRQHHSTVRQKFEPSRNA